MNLPASQIKQVLIDKGIEALYHANTVGTSKTFLEVGGLLSRQYIEVNGLFQTVQKSDEADKQLGIWNDVFFDALNLSSVFSRPNEYGPVLFQYNLNVLDSIDFVSITKSNPIYWKPQYTEEQRYFMSVEDFRKQFRSGIALWDAGRHITLRTINGFLSFDYLEKIHLDETNLSTMKNGQKIMLSKRIEEYFLPDLQRLNIVDKFCTRDHYFLRLAYGMLNMRSSIGFTRLFARKPIA